MRANGINESLSVEADGQGSMHRMASSEDPKLTFEGAAEYYWSMLVDRAAIAGYGRRSGHAANASIASSSLRNKYGLPMKFETFGISPGT